ncbi:MAG: hypothetical protein VST70_05060 [Nitrospirota bacterium]|nr:hypothetical protein [Nitrospirota bacterium]
MMDRTTIAPDFLTLWDTLAKPKTCPELKAAWDQIRDRAEEIDPRGLNELWDFYLERLTECEGK